MYVLCYFSINVLRLFSSFIYVMLHIFVAIDPYMCVSCANGVIYIIILTFL